jgi:perosamine synthetase
MIPRFKPYLGKEEFLTLFKRDKNAVKEFEEKFAKKFKAKEAISFSYGRSALWAFFKAMDIKNTEVIMPAYTCSVVAHAIVLSGNSPCFVDIDLYDYNMNLDQIEASINEKTRAIIATHLFGYPLNIERLKEIVQKAERQFGHKIWVIQDCAHSFGAEWKGKLVCNKGDAAIFGLNISKLITSIFGGMLTTNNSDIAEKIRDYRNSKFIKPGKTKAFKRVFYLCVVYIVFNEKAYGLVKWLQDKTTILNKFTKAYHLDDKIHFPPDYMDLMIPVEARVGLEQLKKYDEIISTHRTNAKKYNTMFKNRVGWELPPIVEGATCSHYVVRVNERNEVLKEYLSKGIELGQIIEYSIPHLAVYSKWDENDCKNSFYCTGKMINLPLNMSMKE